MKFRYATCAVMFLSLASGLTRAQTAAAPAAFWAYDFADSVGVNTHLLHPESIYGQVPLLKQRLLNARIRHIRDGALNQHETFNRDDQAARFKELGDAGIRVTFIFRPEVSREFVQGFPDRVSPSFEAYELPNEMNINNGANWPDTLRTLLPSFSQFARSSSAATRYPIIGPSLADLGNDPYRQLGNQASHFDFGNLHKYYRNYNPATAGYGGAGKSPCEQTRYGSLAYALCNTAQVSDNKPVICTEAGYGSNPAAGKQVTPAVQAKYIARMLLLHLKSGIRRTFLYQLADYGNDGYGSYGLLTATGQEKPAFTELRMLMNELDDSAPTRPLRPLDITLGGETADVQSALFEKSDGSYRLVLWLEKPSYDPRANGDIGQPIVVPAQAVDVRLPAENPVRRTLVFGDTGNATARTLSAPAAGTFRVSVHDNLTILDIDGPERRPQSPKVRASPDR